MLSRDAAEPLRSSTSDWGVAGDTESLLASFSLGEFTEPEEPSGYASLSDTDKVAYLNDRADDDGSFRSQRAATPVTSAGRRLLSTEELLRRPEPTWSVAGLVPHGAFALLVGRNQIGKTFLAFDLAAHMSLGRSWFGRATRRSKVLYAALEGFDNTRVTAWQIHHDADSLADLNWFVAGINLKNRNDQDELIADVRESGAEFVVLDTLNRSISGFDENGSVDMGVAIGFADRLRLEVGAGLLVVHHSPREGSNPRGHSSLEDAADTVLSVTKKREDLHVMEVTKQRNSPSGETVKFRIATHAATGGAVVTAVGPTRDVDQLKGNERGLVQFLVQEPAVVPGTHTALRKRAMNDCGMPKSSFNAALKGLVDKEILDRPHEGKGAPYEWTEAGRQLVIGIQQQDGPT